MSSKPVKKYRCGSVTCAIWKNDDFFSVTLQKSFKKDDNWENTDNLNSGDLLNAAKALERSEQWISEQ